MTKKRYYVKTKSGALYRIEDGGKVTRYRGKAPAVRGIYPPEADGPLVGELIGEPEELEAGEPFRWWYAVSGRYVDVVTTSPVVSVSPVGTTDVASETSSVVQGCDCGCDDD